MLDEAGFPDAIISASSDLDEYLINSLMNQGAKITSWGVGTNLITSKDCPSFGGVYKLACIIDENGTEYRRSKSPRMLRKSQIRATRKFFVSMTKPAERSSRSDHPGR